MNKNRLLRVLITALFLLAALGLVCLVVKQTMPDLLTLLRDADEAALEAYLSRDMSLSGIICMALLQMIQVWSIVISGIVIKVAAGVVYGTWRAFLICQLSSTLAHCISFALCQRLDRYLEHFLPDQSAEKLTLITHAEHPAYMVVTLGFLPIIPNGIISIAASRTKLRLWQFALAMLCGSSFGTFVYCWLGSSLVQGNWLGSALLVALMLLIAVLLWRNEERLLRFIRQLGKGSRRGQDRAAK